MLHATKGIVLRSVKYGETSLVVSVYTELFGLQSYLINGVRSEKKSSAKANTFQPATLLDLIVYHHPHKNLQRIREAKLFHSGHFPGSDVIRYTVGIYMVELIQKAITETESNPDLYRFFEDSFSHVRKSTENSLSNFPVSFTLSFAEHLGFGVQNNYADQTPVFDLLNGHFISENTALPAQTTNRENAFFISEILKDQEVRLNISGARRLELLKICIHYLRLHIPHLAELKSVPVLHEILN